MPLRRIEGVQV